MKLKDYEENRCMRMSDLRFLW